VVTSFKPGTAASVDIAIGLRCKPGVPSRATVPALVWRRSRATPKALPQSNKGSIFFMNAGQALFRQIDDAAFPERIPSSVAFDRPWLSHGSGRRGPEGHFSHSAHPRFGLGEAGRPGLEAGRPQARQKPARCVSLEELLGGQTRGRDVVEGQGRPAASDARTRVGGQIARPAQHANPALPERGTDPLLASTDRRAHVHPRRRIQDRRVLVRRRAAG